MAVKIRLKRMGKKRAPFYRIIVEHHSLKPRTKLNFQKPFLEKNS